MVNEYINDDNTNIKKQCIEDVLSTNYVLGDIITFSTPITVVNSETHIIEGEIQYHSSVITHLSMAD